MRKFWLCIAVMLVAWAPQTRAQDAKGDGQVQWPAPPEKPTGPVPGFLQYNDPYAGEENDLRNPNRTQDEIIAWSQERAAEVLSFTPKNLNQKLSDIQQDFVQQGWQQYSDFMRASDVLNRVQQQGYDLVTITSGDPLIVSSGVAGTENYHWVVQVPLMMTLSTTDADGNSTPASGGNFQLTMQIGRVGTKGVDGLAIEGWKMERAAATP